MGDGNSWIDGSILEKKIFNWISSIWRKKPTSHTEDKAAKLSLTNRTTTIVHLAQRRNRSNNQSLIGLFLKIKKIENIKLNKIWPKIIETIHEVTEKVELCCRRGKMMMNDSIYDRLLGKELAIRRASDRVTVGRIISISGEIHKKTMNGPLDYWKYTHWAGPSVLSWLLFSPTWAGSLSSSARFNGTLHLCSHPTCCVSNG